MSSDLKRQYEQYEPEYSWDYPDDSYPYHSENMGVGRTLAVGSFVRVNLDRSFWSQTSNHLIVRVESDSCLVAIPATLVGKLLLWLRDRADPPYRPWNIVVFWLGRFEDSWVWFENDSPEAYSYLPWLKAESQSIVAHIMNS